MGQLDASVRNLVALYLAGILPREEFASRLPDGWDMDEADDAAGDEAALLVMGFVAEFERGDLDEASLRRSLAPFAAWTTETTMASSSDFVSSQPDFFTRVSLGADTGLQEAAA